MGQSVPMVRTTPEFLVIGRKNPEFQFLVERHQSYIISRLKEEYSPGCLGI